MIMKKSAFLLLLMGLFFGVKAQTYSAPFSFELKLTYTGIVNNQIDSVFKYQAIVTISDSLQLSKVFVKMGNDLGSSDIIDYGFSYTNHNGLPPGTAWHKTGNIITITLGEYIARHYFFEVYLLNKSGAASEIKMWD